MAFLRSDVKRKSFHRTTRLLANLNKSRKSSQERKQMYYVVGFCKSGTLGLFLVKLQLFSIQHRNVRGNERRLKRTHKGRASGEKSDVTTGNISAVERDQRLNE